MGPKVGLRTSLVVQWFRIRAPNAGATGSIPGQGIRTRMQNGVVKNKKNKVGLSPRSNRVAPKSQVTASCFSRLKCKLYHLPAFLQECCKVLMGLCFETITGHSKVSSR